ncbi:MAG: DNA mismatch repair protein MutS, partial [Oscillospiraceae bacterium]
RIVQGAAKDSYGIDVADLAGAPQEVVKRANEILIDIEKSSNISIGSKIEDDRLSEESSENKNSLNNFEELVLEEIKKIDVNSLTPIEAMMLLSNLSKKLKQ